MKILGIETSCDETAICIIETDNNSSLKILGNQLYSQVALHAQYGGVFPMMAKREHSLNLTALLQACLTEANLIKNLPQEISEVKIEKLRNILSREQGLFELFIELAKNIEKPNIDLIAITNGPGLEPALWVGVSFAKALGELWDIPLMPTNHMQGHILVAAVHKTADKEFKIKEINYPAISLLISGGHTQLVLSEAPLQYKIIGNTHDDAVGEAFDKVARILSLPYPGGPEISKLAEKERMESPTKKTIHVLPRPMIHSKDLNFSFSGIKTAVLYMTQKIGDLTNPIKQEIAREFEDAVTEVIIKKTKTAIIEHGAKTLIAGGGVIANKKIRNDLSNLKNEFDIEVMIPEITAATDNAFMIAIAGYINFSSGKVPQKEFVAKGNLSIKTD